MQRLTGEYECKVDAKGRFRMPSSLLRQLSSDNLTFTVNRGFEKNLILYPREVWAQKADEIDSRLNMYNSKQRQVIRYFYRGATEVALDGSDRILLPKTLIKHAGISNKIMLVGIQKQMEIWSVEEYENLLTQEPEEFSQIADELFGNSVSHD